MSLMKELCYTGEMFNSSVAQQVGLIGKVFPDKKTLDVKVRQLAETIASKSPVAVYTLKKVINYQHKEIVARGLEYVAALNMNML